MNMVGAQGDQKRASDPLALGLQMIMSHRMGAGDCTLEEQSVFPFPCVYF